MPQFQDSLPVSYFLESDRAPAMVLLGRSLVLFRCWNDVVKGLPTANLSEISEWFQWLLPFQLPTSNQSATSKFFHLNWSRVVPVIVPACAPQGTFGKCLMIACSSNFDDGQSLVMKCWGKGPFQSSPVQQGFIWFIFPISGVNGCEGPQEGPCLAGTCSLQTLICPSDLIMYQSADHCSFSLGQPMKMTTVLEKKSDGTKTFP